MSEKIQVEDSLKEFMLDINCLQRLNPWISKINLFDILKISRAEIRHSNMLAWLLDATESHGLGDLFIRDVMNELIRTNLDYFERWGINTLTLLTVDFSNFLIYREWANIDILLVSQEDKVVICIENKIGIGEHDDQLKRYQNTVETTYNKAEGYDHIYIFLTPDSLAPSDNRWASFSYEGVLKVLENIIDTVEVDHDAVFIIRNYIETLRRYVVKDKELERICLDIYKKHKQALDLIYDNRPDFGSTVAAILNEYFENRAKTKNDIIYNVNSNTSKTIKRFSMPFFNAILPPIPNDKRFWGDGSNYYWEVKNDYGSGRLAIVFQTCNYEELNGGKIRKLSKLLNNPLKDTWVWKTFDSQSFEYVKKDKLDDFMLLDYDAIQKVIFRKLDDAMERVLKFEEKVKELWC